MFKAAPSRMCGVARLPNGHCIVKTNRYKSIRAVVPMHPRYLATNLRFLSALIAFCCASPRAWGQGQGSSSEMVVLEIENEVEISPAGEERWFPLQVNKAPLR